MAGFIKIDVQTLTSTTYADKPAWDVFFAAMLVAAHHPPFDTGEPEPQLEVRSLTKTGWCVPPGEYGFAPAAGIGLIRTAQIDMEEGLAALERLGAPEPDSRSQEFEGRRLVRIDGGFLILNMGRFRSRDHTAAERQRRYRERRRNDVTRDGDDVTRDVTAESRGGDGTPSASASASPSPSSSASDSDSPKAREARSTKAHNESVDRRKLIERADALAIADPMAASHSPAARDLLATPPPKGARAWRASDATQADLAVRELGMPEVVAVVAFVHASIEQGRVFGEHRAGPKDWSNLWKYNGDPFDRWHQRYLENKPPEPSAEPGASGPSRIDELEALSRARSEGKTDAEFYRDWDAAHPEVKAIGGDDAA